MRETKVQTAQRAAPVWEKTLREAGTLILILGMLWTLFGLPYATELGISNMSDLRQDSETALDLIIKVAVGIILYKYVGEKLAFRFDEDNPWNVLIAVIMLPLPIILATVRLLMLALGLTLAGATAALGGVLVTMILQ